MGKFKHDFVKNYDGLGAFGLNRKTDEETVLLYLQMFSDDSFGKMFLERVSDEELNEIYDFINIKLKTHISENEYHNKFLKDDTHK